MRWYDDNETDVYNGEEEQQNIIRSGNNRIYLVHRWHIWGTPKCFLVFHVRTAVGYNNIFVSVIGRVFPLWTVQYVFRV